MQSWLLLDIDIDVGCGSATFTASVYSNAARPLVLVDRSLKMLTRAEGRLTRGWATLVQADLARAVFGESCTVERIGSMAGLRASIE